MVEIFRLKLISIFGVVSLLLSYAKNILNTAAVRINFYQW